jgi:uncharacterized membrane protein
MPCILKLASEGKKVGFLVAFTWLPIATQGCFLSPPMASYCHTWLSVATYGFLLPHMVSFAAKGYLLQQSAFWFSVATQGFLLPLLAFCCHSSMAFCCHTCLSVAILSIQLLISRRLFLST